MTNINTYTVVPMIQRMHQSNWLSLLTMQREDATNPSSLNRLNRCCYLPSEFLRRNHSTINIVGKTVNKFVIVKNFSTIVLSTGRWISRHLLRRPNHFHPTSYWFDYRRQCRLHARSIVFTSFWISFLSASSPFFYNYLSFSVMSVSSMICLIRLSFSGSSPPDTFVMGGPTDHSDVRES